MKTTKLTLLILVFTIFSCSVDENNEDVKADNKKVDLVTNNLSSSWKTYAYSEFFRGSYTLHAGKQKTEFLKNDHVPLSYLASFNTNDELYISSKTYWNEVGTYTPVSSFNEIFTLKKDTLVEDANNISLTAKQRAFAWKIKSPYSVKAEKFQHLLNPTEFNNLKRANQGRGAEFDKRYNEVNGNKVTVLNTSDDLRFADLWNSNFDEKLIRLDEYYYKKGRGLAYGNEYAITSRFQDFCTFGSNSLVMGVWFTGFYKDWSANAKTTTGLNKTQLVFKDFQNDNVRVVDFMDNTDNNALENFKLVSMGSNALVYASEDGYKHKIAHFSEQATATKEVHNFSTSEKMKVGGFFHDGNSFYLILSNELAPLKLKAVKFTSTGVPQDIGEITINEVINSFQVSCEAYKGSLYIAYQNKTTAFPVIKKWEGNSLVSFGGMNDEPFTKTKTPINLISRNGKMYAFINNDVNDIYKPPCCPSGYIMEVLLFQE